MTDKLAYRINYTLMVCGSLALMTIAAWVQIASAVHG
jgi:hypothetical protein